MIDTDFGQGPLPEGSSRTHIPAVRPTIVLAHAAVLPSRPGRPGRPMDPDLTQRLLEAAIDILAESGWATLNSDRLAVAVGAGKAGIYRRWPSMAHVAAAALRQMSLLPIPRPAADLVSALVNAHAPLFHPPTRDADAVAAVLSTAPHQPVLAAAVDDTLWSPLAGTLTAITAGHTADGVGPGIDVPTLVSLSRSWWCQYLVTGTPLAVDHIQNPLAALTPPA